jgi:hypothetical protein
MGPESLSSGSLPKTLKTTTHKTIICLLFYMGVKTRSHTAKRKEMKVFNNRVVKNTSGPNSGLEKII